jgi:hypothetical protein
VHVSGAVTNPHSKYQKLTFLFTVAGSGDVPKYNQIH